MPPAISHRELSKTISHALRHEPWLYELELDEDGWTRLSSLIEALRSQGTRWEGVSRSRIEETIAASEKMRLEIRGDLIRALYGHSVPGKLKHLATAPPAVLYHGTSPRAARTIREEGLRPMGRQYVHLSVDIETARQVGGRKGEHPVVLEIEAGKAHDAGGHFYEGNDKVWLADEVPPNFIRP